MCKGGALGATDEWTKIANPPVGFPGEASKWYPKAIARRSYLLRGSELRNSVKASTLGKRDKEAKYKAKREAETLGPPRFPVPTVKPSLKGGIVRPLLVFVVLHFPFPCGGSSGLGGPFCFSTRHPPLLMAALTGVHVYLLLQQVY